MVLRFLGHFGEGDPLSPSLFALVADLLGSMVNLAKGFVFLMASLLVVIIFLCLT